MAEVALTSIAKSAFQLFTSLAKDEFLLLWKSKKELQRLQDSIDTISCLLQDADKMQSNANVDQNCLSKLRSVMYNAEDLFDTLAAQVLRKKTMSSSAIFPKEVLLFFSKSNQLVFIVKTAHEVKSLRESVDAIRKDMSICGFRLIEHPPLAAQQVLRPGNKKTHSFVHEEDVIGRDREREDIVNLLLPEGDISCSRSFSVVAIIGFGGLGKTTLAQLVYNDKRVNLGFDVHLWATINDLSNLEQVLIEIIASKEERPSNLGLEKLQKKLRAIIGRRKFLIVLDDVWDEDCRNWVNLETILRCGSIGSKVIVTTRSQEVAKCAKASKPCCVNLGGLSDESAWALFVKTAFDKEELDKCLELESVGKEIVRNCGNVPLAVVIIGSLLQHREKEKIKWSDFLENELKKALSNSGGNTNHESMKRVLMVSYNDLHPNLKLCFAYCSLFPKDYDFDKDELVRLWIAQGFIMPSPNNEQSLEKIGEEYFLHLVERCFFQEVRKYYFMENSRISSSNHLYRHKAKMHDLLHDVAIDVAITESILLDKDSIKKHKSDRLRHISIVPEVVDLLDYCSLVDDSKAIRTLLFHYGHRSGSSLNISMLKGFRMLRTLSLQDGGIINVSDSIGELIHLRYLNLSNTKLKHLPQSICKLQHLMNLVLKNCRLLEKLPQKVDKLVSLRQLHIGGCDRLDCLPPGLIALTSLVDLDRLVVHPHSGGLRYLEGLDNLHGVLRIELPEKGWSNAIGDANRSNMSKKEKLDGMVVDWVAKGPTSGENMSRDDAKAVLDALEPYKSRLEHLEIRGYGGEKLPGWFCMLKNVKMLYLYRCEHVEYLEEEMKDDLCFPFLKSLEFKDMKNLKGWWRQEKSKEMQEPCLAEVSHVTIQNCPKLMGRMPLLKGIEHLNLRNVDVKLVTEILSPNYPFYPSSFAPCDIGNKVKQMHLSCIEGLTDLPEGWIRHLIAIQILDIQFCTGLERVSRRGLSHLTVLKELNLRSYDCEIGNEKVDEGMPWKALRGLETLRLAVGDEHLHEGLQHLTSLRTLEIIKWKDVRLLNRSMGGVKLPSNALQNLLELSMGFDQYRSICHLVDYGIENLHSLRKLTISDCKELHMGWRTLLINMKLESLSFCNVGLVVNVEDVAVGQLSQLSNLYIQITRESKWVHDIPWKSLTSLEQLTLSEIGEPEEIPDGIQHLTTLQILVIEKMNRVRSVPAWFPHLTSLTDLYIWSCTEEVVRRCEKEKGLDWPLILHIPRVEVV